MKNIGILTYHSVCNFGANLQAISTVGYFKKKGFNPVVIDWVPEDVERQYSNTIPPLQFAEHQRFVREHLPLSQRCKSEEDILKQIRTNALDAVVIGSDAVTQHKSLWSRFHFPTRKLFTISPPPPPHLIFPNPFWGSFTDKLNPRIPIIMMSVSSQNEQYIGIQGDVRRRMYETLKDLAYISVRDRWTQKMFKHISSGRIIPPITPDPVFSFNQNAGDLVAPKQILLDKFNISQEYILLSFVKQKSVDRAWLSDFSKISNHNKIECLMLPMPKGHIFEGIQGIRNLSLPLSPLDWYGLIKYSSAYIGHNMHPMVVAMHNNVPFYIFDYYGIVHLKFFVNSQSSKIYDILRKAEMLDQRSRDTGLLCKPPKPETVFESIMDLRNDHSKQSTFSNAIALDYEKMMSDIISVIEHRDIRS
jgi:hypothetical protein